MLTCTPPGGYSPEGDSNGTGPNLPPEAGTVPDELAYVAQLRKRREASWRLPPLADSRRDPLDIERAS